MVLVAIRSMSKSSTSNLVRINNLFRNKQSNDLKYGGALANRFATISTTTVNLSKSINLSTKDSDGIFRSP